MKIVTKLLTAGVLALVASNASAAVPSAFTVTPAPGSTVSELSQITIELNTYNDIYASSLSMSFTINGQSYGKNDISYSWPGFSNIYQIDLKTPITTPGEYTIKFPNGYFYDDWDNAYGGELEWTVTVEGSAVTPPAANIPSYFTVTPEDGATVSELQVITVKYSGNDEFISSFMSKTFTIDGTEYSYKNGDYTFKFLGMYEDTYEVTLKNPITAPGSHLISFPAGYFYVDAGVLKDLDAVSWSVTVENNGGGGGETPTPEIPEASIPRDITVTPENGATVEELSTIIVAYDGMSPYEEFYAYPNKGFTIDGVTYGKDDITSSFPDDYSFKIVLDTPITTPGVHTIKFPKGYFTSEYYSEQDIAEITWSVIIPGQGEGGGETPTPEIPEASIPRDITVTPENGATVEELSTIVVAYEAASPYEEFYAYPNKGFTIDGVTYGKNDITSSFPDDYSFKIVLDTPITAPGVHTMGMKTKRARC